MTKDEISRMVMKWRVEYGDPAAPFPLGHSQHWALVDMIFNLLVDAISERDALRATSFKEYLIRQIEFSERTYGPGLRTLGISEHIRAELEEIAADPSDYREWIDIILLAHDGYWRHGGRPETLAADVFGKLQENWERKWPAAVSEDLPVFHIDEKKT